MVPQDVLLSDREIFVLWLKKKSKKVHQSLSGSLDNERFCANLFFLKVFYI